MTADGVFLTPKRKAAHFDASPISKRPRWSTSLTSKPDGGVSTEIGDTAASVPGGSTIHDGYSLLSSFGLASSSSSALQPDLSNHSATANLPSQSTPIHTPSRKGKEKASDPCGDSHSEDLLDGRTILSQYPPHSSEDKGPSTNSNSSSKGKASSFKLYNLSDPFEAGSSNKPRKHSFVIDLTQEDPIPISSDIESDEQTCAFPTNKGDGSSQLIDLTLDDDDDDSIITAISESLQIEKLDSFHNSSHQPERISTSGSLSDNEGSSADETRSFLLPAAPSLRRRPKQKQSNGRLAPNAISSSVVQSDKEIIDLSYDTDSDRGLSMDSPKGISDFVPVIVSTGTGNDAGSALDENHALRLPQSPILKNLPPSPPARTLLEHEEIGTNLVDSVAELQIDSPRCTSEEETLRVILPEDDASVKEEQHSPRNVSVPCDETAENIPDDEQLPRRTTLVKEPDFSQISAGATEPVPSYDDRLVAGIKWPAEKLSTGLHDMINRLPRHYLFNPQMKYTFEAMIEDNTTEDEPRAPKISIIGRKNGPVTPPWEFYYTNRIVYGEGVPRSDKKLLQGCDCVGPCDPKSKTCACVRRQMAWTGGEVKGFLYKKERLLQPHYPVFECNDACECSEECVNRVVQHGRKHRISIMLTKNKGWGVFAEEKIPRGTYLGIYAGEMILEAEADERGKLYDRYGRTYLFDVDFYHLRSLNRDANKGKDEERTNNIYTIDAFHVGNFTRFLNHSCDPNCQITATYVNEPDVRKPALTIFTSQEVRKGEELTFAYFGEADDDEEMSEEEELDEKTVKVGTGPSPHKQQAIHRQCLCGAANCRGQMF